MANNNNNRIKIKFLDNIRQDERKLVNNLVTIHPVSVRDIYYAKGHAHVVFNNPMDIDKLSTPEATTKLNELKIRILTQTIHPDRSVFVSKLRPYLLDYDYNELKQEINASNNFNVDYVFIIKRQDYQKGQKIALKLIMSSLEDTTTILNNGITIFGFDYPAEYTSKEDPVDIKQCFRCLLLGHETNKCSSKLQYCSKCSGKHNFRDCKSNYIKCRICEGDHLAVSRECPERKAYLKNLIEEKRKLRQPQDNTLSKPTSSHQQPINQLPQPQQQAWNCKSHAHISTPPIDNNSAFPPLARKGSSQKQVNVPTTTTSSTSQHISNASNATPTSNNNPTPIATSNDSSNTTRNNLMDHAWEVTALV